MGSEFLIAVLFAPVAVSLCLVSCVCVRVLADGVVQGNGGQAHVQFVDDADENGVTPQRAVPTIHIIKLPFMA